MPIRLPYRVRERLKDRIERNLAKGQQNIALLNDFMGKAPELYSNFHQRSIDLAARIHALCLFNKSRLEELEKEYMEARADEEVEKAGKGWEEGEGNEKDRKEPPEIAVARTDFEKAQKMLRALGELHRNYHFVNRSAEKLDLNSIEENLGEIKDLSKERENLAIDMNAFLRDLHDFNHSLTKVTGGRNVGTKAIRKLALPFLNLRKRLILQHVKNLGYPTKLSDFEEKAREIEEEEQGIHDAFRSGVHIEEPANMNALSRLKEIERIKEEHGAVRRLFKKLYLTARTTKNYSQANRLELRNAYQDSMELWNKFGRASRILGRER